MQNSSPYERLEEDQTRLDAALESQRTSRNPVTKLFSLVRAEYWGVVVQQDLEEVELADYLAVPQQRSTQE